MNFFQKISNKINSMISENWKVRKECRNYCKKLRKYSATFGTDSDILKMKYTLLRENHVIEKGMSMPNPRKGFGKQKVYNLIVRLEKYFKLYGETDKYFLVYPLSTIKKYIDFTKEDSDIKSIESAFENFLEEVGIKNEELTVNAGISVISKSEISKFDSFEIMLRNRHSIRHFENELPPKETLDKALEMAQLTPSACNRQAWHTHIFFNEKCHELLKMQGGCGGFENDIHCAIVVTADMKGFLSYEPFQQYVDGGLYAMNLINSLHFQGLGTIPLSCGFYHSKLETIQKKFEIPENETMILIIGTGILPENFKIAVSKRKNITETNTYHKS